MDVQVNALAFQQGDLWIVQGIEYDIVARAKDLDSVPVAFSRALAAHACVSEHLGREPLQGIPSAPRQYQEIFAKAQTELRALHELPAGSVAPGSIRVAPIAA